MLGQGTSPEVYPLFTTDGKHVLVVAPDARMRVVVREISVVDGAIRELAGAVDMVFPSLSPDGGAVIYHNQAEPFTHLYRLDLKTGTRTQLTFGDLSSGFGYFSPDGTWITFEFNLRGRDELAVIPAQGGEARVFWNEPGYWYAAGWIPSTDQVLAAGNRGSGWALYAIDVKAKTARQLSEELPLRMYLRYPEMSRDGKRIAYEFNESRGNVFVGELP
jgi:TolB protein